MRTARTDLRRLHPARWVGNGFWSVTAVGGTWAAGGRVLTTSVTLQQGLLFMIKPLVWDVTYLRREVVRSV